MTLTERLAALDKLKQYMHSTSEEWEAVKQQAYRINGWFTDNFVNLAIQNICEQYLSPAKLKDWVEAYQIPEQNASPKKVGIVMAGNIPLVGFHDFLCGFITGHQLFIKLSSKDSVLPKHLFSKLIQWFPSLADSVVVAERLTGCDAYIATGSNNSGRYFDYYFRNYPSIIRKNRTSVAVLNGSETPEQLENLTDDIMLYFGLGCRNVSKIYVPKGYDFVPLLNTLNKYKWMEDHHKYKNNYDYNLSLLLLNSQYYMTNGTLLLVEKEEIFSAISQVNFEFYEDVTALNLDRKQEEIQCIVGIGNTPFGAAQSPSLSDYADGVDTMQFFLTLANSAS